MQGLGGNLESIIKIEGPHKAKLKVTMVLVITFHNNLIACRVLWLLFQKLTIFNVYLPYKNFLKTKKFPCFRKELVLFIMCFPKTL
jgi:hypothetical protein